MSYVFIRETQQYILACQCSQLHYESNVGNMTFGLIEPDVHVILMNLCG